MSELDLPTYLYNWMVSFFSGHAHRTCTTVRCRLRSQPASQSTASIVQGSSICPAFYAVTAADGPKTDTYLVIPAASADTRVAELGHIAAWAAIWPSYMVKLWLSYMA